MQLLRGFLEGSNINHGYQSCKEDCFLVESYFCYFSFVPAELARTDLLVRKEGAAEWLSMTSINVGETLFLKLACRGTTFRFCS